MKLKIKLSSRLSSDIPTLTIRNDDSYVILLSFSSTPENLMEDLECQLTNIYLKKYKEAKSC